MNAAGGQPGSRERRLRETADELTRIAKANGATVGIIALADLQGDASYYYVARHGNCLALEGLLTRIIAIVQSVWDKATTFEDS